MQTQLQSQHNQRFTVEIKTEHVKPPIATRECDWRAFVVGREDEREATAYGPTEDAAVEALLDQMGVTR